MAFWLALVLLVTVAHGGVVPKNDVQYAPECRDLYHMYNLSPNFNETIAHAIHSMTVRDLRMFNPRATMFNRIPTVNYGISHEQHLVLPYAPEDSGTNEDFITAPMNVIDVILSRFGKEVDGLGPNWSSTERLVHKFYMYDVWASVLEVYKDTVMNDPPQDELCDCLLKTEQNGIYDAVRWVAEYYKSNVVFSLQNRPFPKLKDAKSWGIWKKRLLHYYTQPALHDASLYLYCATKHF